jgi:hypothetical protein
MTLQKYYWGYSFGHWWIGHWSLVIESLDKIAIGGLGSPTPRRELKVAHRSLIVAIYTQKLTRRI